MAPPDQVTAFAPAKINLTLHVTGQRDDGYHLLDSLVMLVDVGDRLTVRHASHPTMTVTGARAKGVPTDKSNLVLRAAALMGISADIALEKNLPAASGIGGGSSDAAACLRAVSKLANAPLPTIAEQLSLGADVPVCMHNALVRMGGIGEKLELLGMPANWPIVLVNPGIEVPTAAIFERLKSKANASMPDDYPIFADWGDQVTWLSKQRNDLETPAIEVAPVIADVLHALKQSKGCMMARMSGSGATCFAIMSDDAACEAAVERLRAEHPTWWAVATERCGVEFA